MDHLPRRIGRILVPVDFSDNAKAALQYARMLADKFGAEVHVLHVYPEPAYITPDMVMAYSPGTVAQGVLEFVRGQAARDLDAFLDAVGKEGSGLVTGRLETGDPFRRIIEVATLGHYDLLVMGTHGRTGISHLLLGSVAERVVRHSPCPVLTIRAATEAPAVEVSRRAA